MSSLHENIKKYRLEMGLTQADLAEKIGYADKSMIAKIESGKATPPYKKLETFAQIFEISVIELVGGVDVFKKELLKPPSCDEDTELAYDLLDSVMWKHPHMRPHAISVPLLEEIKQLDSILNPANIHEYIAAPGWISASFAVTALDDSMLYAGISENATVFIDNSTVENGQLGAVLIDGWIDIRRIYRDENILTLQTAHPDYPPQVFTGKDINSVLILGKAVYVLNELR